MAALQRLPMLTQEQAVEIRVMARRGEGLRAIARQVGCSRNTVRRYLRNEAACGFTPRLCPPYRAKTKGKVERFNSYLKGSFVVPLASSLEGSRLGESGGNLLVLAQKWPQ